MKTQANVSYRELLSGIHWKDSYVPEVNRSLQVVQGLLALLVNAPHTLPKEDHSTTRSTERLVGGSSHDIRVQERSRDDLSSDQTGNVGHVDNKVGTDKVSNLAHTSIVDVTAVRRGTSNEDLGAVEDSGLLEHLVVDDTSLGVDTVWHGLEVDRDSGDPASSLALGQNLNIPD